MTGLRKLIALDEDDLAVISAHVQDASVHIADILWLPQEKRLVVGMKRLDWDQVLCGQLEARRLVTALRFDRVLACQVRKLALDEPDKMHDLVGLEFHPGKRPGGCVVLMFDGGAALRLEVECIECELADLKECTAGQTMDAAGGGAA